MNAILPSNQSDIDALQQAIIANHAMDTLSLKLTKPQWDALAQYLQPFTLKSGQLLVNQGAIDRSVYLVEAGSLSVHFQDEQERIRMAMVGPGSVVGEGAFFSQQPRTATVQAASECRLWGLAPMRYRELSNRHPTLALALVEALGGVLARRYANKPKRLAIT
jgi:CRP/FNR family transcriptional regulator, cyclic AMP receptor protein